MQVFGKILHRSMLAGAVVFATLHPLLAEKMHGIAMYGEPALPPDFVSLPYVNPDAPKGGKIVFGEPGTFDSLNAHILKGSAPYGVGAFVFETLMSRSYDEPFTLYGLLAESVETDANRTWVEFTLNPQAKFSDGSPVTVDDVLWSFQTLGEHGHPRYQTAWKKIAKSEITGPLSIKFTFSEPDRELPLILALRPILKKAQWEGRDFEQSGFDVVPIGSAAYVIGSYDAGKNLVLKRNPDYWGNDLPINRGKWNFDEIRYEYFTDATVIFEAFTAGILTTFRETNAAKWTTAYNFPAVQSGDVVKSVITHERPSGISGYVMNTRRDVFKDWRVREAMIEAFNFEFYNQVITGGLQPRIQSYFSNSILGYEPGPASGRELELLQPFAADLPSGTIEGYTLPVSDGSERNRANIAKALDLFEQAGWTVEDGVMKNAKGEPFTFEILLVTGATETQQTMDLYVAALERLGIRPTITSVDNASYQERTNVYDFDMAYYLRGLSLSPGNEQTLYWGSASADAPGTRNWMGVKSPAVDAMINTMLNATSREEAIAATHALDRILTAGRYVIPIWFSRESFLAHSKNLHFPDKLPIYGDWTGFQPDVWWYQE